MAKPIEAPKRKRPTLTDQLSQAHEMIEALLLRKSGEPGATVEFSRNARGDTQIVVKVTDHPEAAYVTALALYERACKAYPRQDEA